MTNLNNPAGVPPPAAVTGGPLTWEPGPPVTAAALSVHLADDRRAAGRQQLSRRAFLLRACSLAAGAAAVAVLAGCRQETPTTAIPTPTASPMQTAPTVTGTTTTGTAPPAPTAISARATPSGPRPGGSFVGARLIETNGLDPQFDASLSRLRLTPLLYSNLVRFAPDLTVVPDLAERWEWAPDGSSVTFSLRSGVRWHPPVSRPVTAADVKWSFERLLEKGADRAEFKHIRVVEAVGTTAVRFHLSRPDGVLVARLADCRWGAVVNRETVQKYGTVRERAVGTGPFLFDAWLPGQELRLKRNPEYFVAGRPYLDRVTIRVIADLDAILAGLRTGTVHQITLDDVQAAARAGDASIVIVSGKGLGYEFVNFNCRQAPVSTLQVRQAISAALDRQELVRVAAKGLGTLTAPLAPALARWQLPADQWLPSYAPDPARARALLTAAGVAPGITIPLLVTADVPSLAASAALVQQQLKQVGIQVDVQSLDYPEWLRRYHTLDFVMTMNSSAGAPDPDQALYPALSSKGDNWNLLKDTDVDKLLDDGRATPDEGMRKAVYDRLQRLLIERPPQLWTYSPNRVDALAKTVRGFVQHPTGELSTLADVWLAEPE
ncbi:MAG: hypothetical protein HY331_01980 [Chloroflexi bacterium]|nr:hypothetical protein [Chloroflexota bacterium]